MAHCFIININFLFLLFRHCNCCFCGHNAHTMFSVHTSHTQKHIQSVQECTKRDLCIRLWVNKRQTPHTGGKMAQICHQCSLVKCWPQTGEKPSSAFHWRNVFHRIHRRHSMDIWCTARNGNGIATIIIHVKKIV